MKSLETVLREDAHYTLYSVGDADYYTVLRFIDNARSREMSDFHIALSIRMDGIKLTSLLKNVA